MFRKLASTYCAFTSVVLTMAKNYPLLLARIAIILTAVLASESYCLLSVSAKTGRMTTEVRVSREDGLITMMFHTPSGGKVCAFLPANAQPSETQIGGTVERELPTDQPAANSSAALAEISGVVTIEPKRKDKIPPVSCPSNTSDFTCQPPDDGEYKVTYKPPDGTPCTQTVNCPPGQPSDSSSDTCGIPQLTSNSGNFYVTMLAPPNGNPSANTCTIGGVPATCRAWSKTGSVFHVPSSAKVPPGPAAVTVSRGNLTAQGQTHVAAVTMTCVPNHLKPGQPCTVTTTVFCPGMNSVVGGKVLIKNYSPSVLNMPDKVIPIPHTGP